MNSRKLIALFLVFALTGSALAAQQQRMFRGSDDGDLEASSVTSVQQHSVFIEIVIERQQQKEQIHEFAAVVGLIKECKQVRNEFDNAVLWFNDQFLFGDKVREEKNVTPNASLGFQPGENLTDNEGATNPFVGTNELGTPRWSGCFTPDGFAHAIGADDPFGVVKVNTGQDADGDGENESVSSRDGQQAADDADDLVFGGEGLIDADDGMDLVKEMMGLDNQCGGCIFEYHSSFFVVDPNDHRWIVDKYVYPLSVMGNFFHSGSGENCGDDESDETSAPINVSDPREKDSPFINQHHADRCEDPQSPDDDRRNHCFNDTSTEQVCDGDDSDDDNIFPTTDNSTLVEPLFSTHLQTDPTTPTGLGFADRAAFQYEDTGADDTGTNSDTGVPDVREGAIYPSRDSPKRADCEADLTFACAIEYNFLIAVDFSAFDDRPAPGEPGAGYGGEDEIDRGCAVEHGEGGADNDTEHWQGNSHPHAPNEDMATAQIPQHCHPTVNLDIFFHDTAPNYTMEHQYWTNEHGTPLEWGPQCNTATGTASDGQQPGSIDARTPIVCDVDADDGEFHSPDHIDPGEN